MSILLKIPRGQFSWSVADQRSEDNMEILRTLLEKPLDPRQVMLMCIKYKRRDLTYSCYLISGTESAKKSQLLYRSCLDSTGEIEKLGKEPLLKVISDVGGWNLTGGSGKGFKMEEFDLREKMVRLSLLC